MSSSQESTPTSSPERPGESGSSPERPVRGRGRGRARRGGGRLRGRVRTRGGRGGHAAQEETRADHALRAIESRKTRMRSMVQEMQPDRLRELFSQMMESHPSLVFNILEPAERQPGGYHPPQDSQVPDWCVCGKCREMPTDLEKVCCGYQHCMSQLPDFQVLVLDEAVLAIARMYRQDILVMEDDGDFNKSNRHAAYRQFILWQHGRLGAGRRRVIPSCCVWRIRDKYPDPFAQYKGFIPTRLG